jgi:hypothetical protein
MVLVARRTRLWESSLVKSGELLSTRHSVAQSLCHTLSFLSDHVTVQAYVDLCWVTLLDTLGHPYCQLHVPLG